LKVNLMLLLLTITIGPLAKGQTLEEKQKSESPSEKTGAMTLREEMKNIIPGAETSPLPKDIFLRFQAIKLHGDGCSSNYRFQLFRDGRFFLQENQSEDCHLRPKGSKFNQPYDAHPLVTLSERSMERIDAALKNHRFMMLDEMFKPREKVFDGSVKILEASVDSQTRRVTSFQSSCPAIEAILEIIWEQVY